MSTIYRQRNTLAVALAWANLSLGLPAGRGFDQDCADRGDEPGWGHVIYLRTPDGDQVSYHVAPDDVDLLEGLPTYNPKWDGTYNGRESWWLKQYKEAVCN